MKPFADLAPGVPDPITIERDLTVSERQWLAAKQLKFHVDSDSVYRGEPPTAHFMHALFDLKGMPRRTELLTSVQQFYLQRMPEPMRFMFLADDTARLPLVPILHAFTHRMLEKTFVPADGAAYYRNREWVFLDLLHESHCINPHWRRHFARLYALLCACFQRSIRDESKEYFYQQQIDLVVRSDVPYHDGDWLVLKFSNHLITSVKEQL